MDFKDFRKEIIGRDEKGKTNAALSFIYSVPIESEEEPGTYELLVCDLLTINKPEVDLIYIAEPFHSKDFIQLNIKFQSTYDPDIQELYSFLQEYKNEVNEYFDDISRCSSMTVCLTPVNMDPETPHYMELNFPIMVFLQSSRTNQIPDTISLLFDIEDCQFVEDVPVDMNELKEEIRMENEREEREQRYLEQKMKEEEEHRKQQEEKLIKLQEQMLKQEQEKDRVIRVGRNYDDQK